jgi:carbonyl reductase 1
LGYPATPYSGYSVSKIALIAITRIQQKQFDKDSTTRNKDIIVSSLCPGYVDTDMSKHQGHLTVEQGAETPIHLALLPENASVPKGAFWAESKPFDWFTEDFKLP